MCGYSRHIMWYKFSCVGKKISKGSDEERVNYVTIYSGDVYWIEETNIPIVKIIVFVHLIFMYRCLMLRAWVRIPPLPCTFVLQQGNLSTMLLSTQVYTCKWGPGRMSQMIVFEFASAIMSLWQCVIGSFRQGMLPREWKLYTVYMCGIEMYPMTGVIICCKHFEPHGKSAAWKLAIIITCSTEALKKYLLLVVVQRVHPCWRC